MFLAELFLWCFDLSSVRRVGGWLEAPRRPPRHRRRRYLTWPRVLVPSFGVPCRLEEGICRDYAGGRLVDTFIGSALCVYVCTCTGS